MASQTECLHYRTDRLALLYAVAGWLKQRRFKENVQSCKEKVQSCLAVFLSLKTLASLSKHRSLNTFVIKKFSCFFR